MGGIKKHPVSVLNLLQEYTNKRSCTRTLSDDELNLLTADSIEPLHL